MELLLTLLIRGIYLIGISLWSTHCFRDHSSQMVLLLEEGDNVTTLIVQRLVQTHRYPLSTAVSPGPPLNTPPEVVLTRWPTGTGHFKETAKIVSTLQNSTGLMVAAVARSCSMVWTLHSTSSSICPPVVILSPHHCRVPWFAPASHSLDVQLNLAVLVERVLAVAEHQNQGPLVLFLDETSRDLLEDHVDILTFTPNVRVLQVEEMYHKAGAAYQEIMSHRDIYRVFVVLASSKHFRLLKVARELDILSPVQSWVVVNFDSSVAAIGLHFLPGDNVVVIDARRRFQQMEMPPDLQRIIPENRIYLWDFYHALVLLLKDVIAEHDGNSTRCTTEGTYTQMGARLEKMTSLGVWSTSPGWTSLTKIDTFNPYDTYDSALQLVQPFMGFHGRVFNITTLPNKIFQIRKSDGTFEGLAFDLLDEVAKNLNFSYIITPPPDGQWGARAEDGMWTGMIGMVMKREVDFAVGSFTITSGREEVIDFTFPYWQGSAGMAVRLGDSNRLLNHLSPFSLSVWACLVSSIPVVAAALWAISTFSLQPTNTLENSPGSPSLRNGRCGEETTTESKTLKSQDHRGHPMKHGLWEARSVRTHNTDSLPRPTEGADPPDGERERNDASIERQRQRQKISLNRLSHSLNNNRTPGFWHVLFLTYGITWQQSLSWMPLSSSGRVTLCLTWLVYVILAATYTSNLTAVLAVPPAGVPVDSLDDLAAQTSHQVGLVKGQALADIFMNAPSGSLYHRIWKKIDARRDNVVSNLTVGRARLMSEHFVYLDDIKNLRAIQAEEADKGDCSVYIAKQQFYFSGYAFPLQPKSPYLYIFNREILKIMASGVAQKWMKRYMPNIEEKCGKGNVVVKPASLQDALGLFYFLALGLLLSLLVFSGEVIVGKRRRRSPASSDAGIHRDA